MEQQLFTRDGAAFTGKVRTDSKGKPYHAYIASCMRCGGHGGWEGWPGFTCFRCGGSGREYEPTIVKLYDADRLAKLQAAEARRNERKAAKVAAEIAAKNAARGAFYASLPASVRSLVTFFDAPCDSDDAYAARNALERRYGAIPVDIAATVWRNVAASERQLEVLQNAVERVLAREAEQAALQERSQHVGAVGGRIELTLEVRKVLRFESTNYGWPPTYINLCRDAAGNAVVYKGSTGWTEGETIVVKATVKEHGERDGVKQTVIQRPKIIA